MLPGSQNSGEKQEYKRGRTELIVKLAQRTCVRRLIVSSDVDVVARGNPPALITGVP